MTDLSALLGPTVLAAVVAALVAIVMPFISARIKRAENGRLGAVAVEVRKIEATQQMLDRLTAEVERLQHRIDVLEECNNEMNAALVMIEAEMHVMQSQLEGLGAADLALRAVRVLEHVRRGRGVGLETG